MKVTGPYGSSQAGAAKGARATGAGGFALPSSAAAETPQPVRAAGVTGVASLDALLALQQADGPLERRRRAVNRGGRLLDVLDQMKLAMLGGESAGPALQRLGAAVREAREGTDDARLDGVLDEIETRAAVELAKAEMSRLAA